MVNMQFHLFYTYMFLGVIRSDEINTEKSKGSANSHLNWKESSFIKKNSNLQDLISMM